MFSDQVAQHHNTLTHKAVKLTDLVSDLIRHTGNFVEQIDGLIHPLIDHTQVGQNLKRLKESDEVTVSFHKNLQIPAS